MKRVNFYGYSHSYCYRHWTNCFSYTRPAMSHSMTATATTLIAGSLIPDGDTVLKLKIMQLIFHIIVVLHIPYPLRFYGQYYLLL